MQKNQPTTLSLSTELQYLCCGQTTHPKTGTNPATPPSYHQHAGRARSSQFIFGLDGSRRPLVREWERSAS